jgi:hypothetical protein
MEMVAVVGGGQEAATPGLHVDVHASRGGADFR